MPNAFTLTELENQITLLTFDLPGQRVNTFSSTELAELEQIVSDLEKRTELRGLLLASGKPRQFIAGANLKELGSLARATAEQVKVSIEFGHDLFDRVSKLPFPTVALIDGHCMGGGTELVLSMDYRIAGPNAKIALPEVKVGLIPGWGGTQRLPRVVGIGPALEMICGGEPVDAAKAVEIGLVWDTVPSEALQAEGIRLLEYTIDTAEWSSVRKQKSLPLGLTEDQAEFAFETAEQFVMQKTGGHYPAPLIALRSVKDGINLPLDKGLAIEREAAMDVFGTNIAANLIGIFFDTTRLGSDTGVDDNSIKAEPRSNVGVLGAGAMGAGIATASARVGLPTTMVDISDERIAVGMAAAQKVVGGRIKIGRAKPQDMADMLALLNTSTSQRAFEDCDVVIEAVTENEELKKKIYGELSQHIADDAILASNTSTISITRMAAAAPNAELFVGMHFFNPVDRMQLVEVVRGEKTSDQTVATTVALAKKMKKTPIVVQDCPGFLVNRILMPYMAEALLLLQEGADMNMIDKVAVKWGMPMGPIALHDMVGLDVCVHAGSVMQQGYLDRAIDTPVLKEIVDAGRLGKKNGKGFRKFDAKGRPVPDPDVAPLLAKHQANARDFTPQEIEDRLFVCMTLEAVRAWSDGIVRHPGDVDMGLILGTGFPPFRGGPLRWCDDEGAATLIERSEPYHELGARFEPPAMLLEMAGSGEKFHRRAKVEVTA